MLAGVSNLQAPTRAQATSQSKRGSGIKARVSFGSMVQNGKLAASAFDIAASYCNACPGRDLTAESLAWWDLLNEL